MFSLEWTKRPGMYGIQTGTKQRCFCTSKSGGMESIVHTGQDGTVLTPYEPSLSLMQLDYAIHLIPSQLFYFLIFYL